MTFNCRPISWRSWLAWIGACAFAPVAGQIMWTAGFKEVPPSDPPIMAPALGAIFIALIILPRIAEAAALRLVFPKLSVVLWVLATFVAGIIFFTTVIMLPESLGGAVTRLFSVPGRQFVLDWRRANQFETVTLSTLLALPWSSWITSHVGRTIGIAWLPALLLRHLSGIPVWRFLIAAIVGSLCASSAEVFLLDSRIFQLGLNGLPSLRRFQMLTLIAATGAIWGASSGLALILLMRDRSPERARLGLGKTWNVLLAASLVALAAAATPTAVSLFDPRNRHVAWQKLQRAFSSAPARDQSVGQKVLTYSHDIQIVRGGIPASAHVFASFAPDSESFITLGEERRFERIEIATGQRLAELDERQRRHARWQVAWSPDGKYLAFRTEGDEFAIPNSRYTRRQTRIRLYDTANNAELADFETTGDSCFDSGAAPSMIFSADGQALWISCEPHLTPNEASFPEAIKLSIPNLKFQKAISIGENKRAHPRALFLSAGVAFDWLTSRGDGPLIVRDLDQERDVTVIPKAALNARSEGKTLRRGIVHEDGARLELVFCGWAVDRRGKLPVSDCRSVNYNPRTGAYLGTRDWIDGHELVVTSARYSVKSDVTATSKAGVIIVTGIKTGKELQRIHSWAQHPVGFSPDGQWLVMFAPDLRKLRVYRVQQ